MKSILILGLGLGMMGASLCLAESWNGKLLDAACLERQAGSQEKPDACGPSRMTTMFVVQIQDGRMLRLDSTGNAKAAEMMHNATGPRSVTVTVTGTQNGRTLRVETIELQ
ncbi:MAG: hypothetical protein LAO79_17465 [Acidobacteriia bacterium]|nr:hypothetical protein [Terriglobia bacterium]